MVKKGNRTAKPKREQRRPPIVAVLGHVDHGKTTLLDQIRRTRVAVSESGGITQHIGAYQVAAKNGRKITFIDTPGHLAFSQMRSRGAKAADLVVLVVAVDEGVKPQTLESLKHIHSAGVSYLVALTKIDLPNTNVERVKKELVKNSVSLEGQGGDIVCVPVSGKTGKGIQELLEMILLLAEMAELSGSPEHPLKGVVIESRLDSQQGFMATVLIRDGRLKTGDVLEVEGETAKVKAMFDENRKKLSWAGPSDPVEILGFKKAPVVGSLVKMAGKRISEEKRSTPSVIKETPEKESKVFEQEEKKFKIVLKADNSGTLEAVIGSLPREVEIIHSGVGQVSESDVLLAETTGAEIVAFRVKIPSPVQKLARTEGIEAAGFKIIYELLKEVEKKALRAIEPTIDEKVLGRAQILEEFEMKKERIAGCQVIEGEIKKTDSIHLSRQEVVMGNCRLKSMKRGKEVIGGAKKGEEFGAILSPSLDFAIGDMLVSFRKIQES